MRYTALDYALALAAPVVLLLLTQLLQFNGLYGQDAYEYLRQTTALRDYWQGQPMLPPTLGDRAYAAGFPVLGALLSSTGLEPLTALRLLNALATGLAAWYFMACIRVLTPGAPARSRYTWVLVFLTAPIVVRSGSTTMSDITGLATLLAALYYGLLALEHPHWRTLLACGLWAGVAGSIRWVEGLLLLPLGLFLWVKMTRQRHYLPLLSAALGLSVGFFLHYIGKKPLDLVFTIPSTSGEWSLWHLFQRHFSTTHGVFSYTLPNIVYVLSPLVHPACCAALLLLSPLWRRTDLHLSTKKILLAGIVLYLLCIGGMPFRSVRYLLPVWACILLLWFPAWDRCVSYGRYFVPRVLNWVLAAVFTLQIGCTLYEMYPIVQFNRWEQRMAAQLRQQLPPEAAVYGMEIDISLRHYLPQFRWYNTWAQRFDSIPADSYFLLNERLYNTQWKGHNPQFNFEQVAPRLDTVAPLERDWWLMRVK
jgi:Dolichyl-phosphate-mannose-protein mannosyltransferase